MRMARATPARSIGVSAAEAHVRLTQSDVVMRVVAVVVLVLALPLSAHAQRAGAFWGVGTSLATNPVVRDAAAAGRLQPAFLAEFGAYAARPSGRRLGMLLQAVPLPDMRVTGTNLQGRSVSRSVGGPLLVLRLLTDIALWRVRHRVVPSFGFGYSAYISPAGDCTSGEDSPLCGTAARIHGAHGVTAHAGLSIAPSANRVSLDVRYVATRAPDLTTRDLTLGIRWRATR